MFFSWIPCLFFKGPFFVFGRFFQDFYERYALYERQNLHGRLKRPASFRGLVTVGVGIFMAFFGMCVIYKNGGGARRRTSHCLFVWFMNDFCTLPNLVCPVESWPQLDRRLYGVTSWHRTRWRPNPYAREDADFAQQNIRTLLRPFSHQAAAGADQDSHFKGAFFLEKQLPAAGWARPRCSMYREHYRWHSSPLARVFPLVVWLSASSHEVSLKLSPSNELTNFASVLSCFGPLQPSSKSSLDTVTMMHHSMNPLTLQHTFQHSPCLGLKQLRPVIWDVSKGNQVQQTSCILEISSDWCNESRLQQHPETIHQGFYGYQFLRDVCFRHFFLHVELLKRWSMNRTSQEVAGLKRHDCDHAIALIRFLAGYRSCEGGLFVKWQLVFIWQIGSIGYIDIKIYK